jgi:hypothetical protein
VRGLREKEERCVWYIGRWGFWLVHDRDGKGYVTEDEVVHIDEYGWDIDACWEDEEVEEE